MRIFGQSGTWRFAAASIVAVVAQGTTLSAQTTTVTKTAAAAPPPAAAQPATVIDPTELMRKLYCLEQRQRQLEQELKTARAQPAAAPDATPTVVTTEPANTVAAPATASPPVAAGGKSKTGAVVPEASPCSPDASKEIFALPPKAPPTPPAGKVATAQASGQAAGQSSGGFVFVQPGAQPAAAAAPGAAPAAATAGGFTFVQPGAQPAVAPVGPTAPAQPGMGADGLPATGISGNSVAGLGNSLAEAMKIGAYGEIKYGAKQNPDPTTHGQWQNGFDAARMVLLPYYAITPNLIFNAEIEFEHAGTGFDNDDKLHGTAEVEQLFIDMKVNDYVNFHLPGVDLVPFGWINLYHEPVNFYSVERPTLENGIIPTTWREPSTMMYGKIVDGLRYQFQISMGLEDYGDQFQCATDGNTVPLQGNTCTGGNGYSPVPGYAPGIDGINSLAFSHAPTGDFKQLTNDLGYAFRLAYDPPFLKGFSGSSSIYYVGNTTPRGAYADNGQLLGKSSLTMYDTEARYRLPDTGLELRGEYVGVTFGNPNNLRANNDSDPTNNVGKTMYGFSGEAAYHIPLGTILKSDWEAVPFYRFTRQNFQTGGLGGYGSDPNAPIGAGKVDTHVAGLAVFPSPKLVFKLDYTHVKDEEVGGAKSDTVLGGIGFHF